MEKLFLCAISLIVVTSCLLPACIASTQDVGGGKKQLWDEIWKNIKADDETLPDDGVTADKKSLKKTRWIERVQERLDEDALPSYQSAVKPAAPTATDMDFVMILNFLKSSDITLSNNQWMSFLQYVLFTKNNNGKALSATNPTVIAELNNNNDIDIEKDRLKEVSESESKMSKGTDVNFRRGRIAGNSDGKETTRLPISSEYSPPSTQNGSDEKGFISDEQWDRVLERVMANGGDDKRGDIMSTRPSTTSSTPSSPLTTHHAGSTSTPEPTRFVKERFSISDEQWEALLERYFRSDPQRGDVDETEAQENKTATGGNGMISDEEWKRALQNMFDGNNIHEKENDQTTPTPPAETTTEAKTSEATSGDGVADAQWESLLRKAFDGDREQKDLESTQSTHLNAEKTDKSSSSKNISDTDWENILQKTFGVSNDGHKKDESSTPADEAEKTPDSKSNDNVDNGDRTGDRQWLHLLQRALNIRVGDDADSGAVDDRQWAELLQHVMELELLSSQSQSAFNDDTPGKHAADVTKSPTTAGTTTTITVQSANGKGSSSSQHDEPQKPLLSDREWEHVLQAAMDNNNNNDDHDQSKGVQSLPSHHTTENPITHQARTDSGHQPTADEQWETFLNSQGNAPNTKTSSPDQLSPLLSEKTTSTSSPTPVSSTTEEEIAAASQGGSAEAQAFSSADKVVVVKKNDDHTDNNTNFYLLLGFGIGTGVLLICLIVATVLVVCRRKGVLCWSVKDIHTTVLNVDGNRWDPQALRPSKENMNAFLYGIPVPMEDIRIAY